MHNIYHSFFLSKKLTSVNRKPLVVLPVMKGAALLKDFDLEDFYFCCLTMNEEQQSSSLPTFMFTAISTVTSKQATKFLLSVPLLSTVCIIPTAHNDSSQIFLLSY